MTTAFEFTTVPALIVDHGAARRLGAILRKRHAATRLCLVTDAFLHRSGLLAPTLADLKDHGFDVTVIDDVVADPPDHVVLAASARALESRAEIVVGLGGGSSMDVAKLIAVLAASDQQLADMYGIGNVRGPRLPLIQVPTTAGTGSEVTHISIVTTGATTKSGVVSPMLYADLAILDAELTMGLPPAATAATGIDAMVHAIEAYTSAKLKNPLSDMLAQKALTLLAANIVTACQDGSNRAAREAMLLGATLAGQAFSNSPVAAVHALAYPLGGNFHVPHGLSNALVLPHVLRFNASHAADQYADIASWIVTENFDHGASAAEKTEALIAWLDRIAVATGVTRRLRDVGVAMSDLPLLASDAMKQQRLLTNNPRELNEADALAIYTAAF
ncbi:MAG: iron-containing alcohol dehydrogenase [Janthinobacterium lividum]